MILVLQPVIPNPLADKILKTLRQRLLQYPLVRCVVVSLIFQKFYLTAIG